MPVAIPEVMRFRQRTGADRFDEMWEGVLHMAPSPTFRHRSRASRILAFFVDVWAPRTGGAAVMQINVSTAERWDQDYRIPDVAVMLPDRMPRGEAMFVQPTVVFEIRSPGDETYEKLHFYAAVGVDALVVVERDSNAAQVFARSGENFVLVPPSAESWTLIAPVGVELQAEPEGAGAVLHLRLQGEPETARAI